MHEECYRQIRHLENLTDQQARLITTLRSQGLLGWFQRRRIGKANRELPERLKIDELRNQNVTLKARIRELEEQLGRPR